MVKTEITKLANGLDLIICEDKNKHSAYAELITKFGGLTKDFTIDGKEYHLIDGIAHLLEHTLVDTGKKGNLLKYYSDNYAAFNGVTSKFTTSFYIDTVENFEDHLRTLIEEINIANFTEESLKDIKKPIYEEIKRSDDRPYRKFHEAYIKGILPNANFISNIGNIEEIREVSYELVKLCHDTFYHPSNQIMLLSGNFDTKNVKKIIEDTYEKIGKKKISFSYLDTKIPDKFAIQEQVVTDNKDDNIVMQTYRVDISKFKGHKGLKLSYYLHYFLRYNFDDTSSLFEDLIKKNYTAFSIDTSIMKVYDNLFIDFGCYTTEKDYFVDKVKDIINNRGNIDSDKFNLLHKKDIVQQILREEECGKILKSIYDNIVDHDLYEEDSLEIIESLNIDEYKEFMEMLEFFEPMVTVHKNIQEEICC